MNITIEQAINGWIIRLGTEIYIFSDSELRGYIRYHNVQKAKQALKREER